MRDQMIEFLSGRRGHFLLESGHHGDLWLDLEFLCLRPRRVQRFATELASALCGLRVDAICGPLVEGSFVALLVALELDVQFTYSERYTRPGSSDLFPASYRVPASLREGLRGKRVAIVNDVINAGSAVRGTLTDLEQCGATVVAIGALLVLGTAAATFAASEGIPLQSLAQSANDLWEPSVCPLCASGVPLEDVASFATTLSN